MATSLTTNLKLRISPDLTTDSKYNLQRIDSLASLYQVNSNAVARIRSQTDIILQPQDPDIGGTGTGGSISFGTDDQPVSTINFRATTISSNAAISSSGNISTTGNLVISDGTYNINVSAPTLSTDYSLVLPTTDGSANQVLTTDGSGNLSWSTVAGAGGGGQELSTSWLAADGATKTITHGFGSQSVMVQVLDTQDDYKTVEVDVVSRPTVNTVILESSITPVNWLVLLKEI